MMKEQLVDFWLESSDEDYLSMHRMFANREFVWSLFVGHLCLEKLLKAIYVKNVDHVVPRSHDLYKLAARSGIAMTKEQMDSLQYVTMFNIEARYQDYKRDFQKKCTKEFSQASIATIEEIREWLLPKIKN